MSTRLSPLTAALLTVPPLMWASNAVVGRLAVAGRAPLVSPVLFNALRWTLALAILLVIARFVDRDRPGHSARAPWLLYAVFGLLAVTAYNALQYASLQTTTAINATLISASGPFFMLALGRLFFAARPHPIAWTGALVSLAGVLVVLTAGEPRRIAQLQLVSGDLLMLLATLDWALYSWLLRRHRPMQSPTAFMIAQTAWGALLATPFVAIEWATGALVLEPDARTVAVIAWAAIGPSVLAYYCWDRGIAKAGALLPAFFANLSPLFAALMSAALLGEPPAAYHALAFVLIAGGIVMSQHR